MKTCTPSEIGGRLSFLIVVVVVTVVVAFIALFLLTFIRKMPKFMAVVTLHIFLFVVRSLRAMTGGVGPRRGVDVKPSAVVATFALASFVHSTNFAGLCVVCNCLLVGRSRVAVAP